MTSKTEQPLGIPLLEEATFEADWAKLASSLGKGFLEGVGAIVGLVTSPLPVFSNLLEAATSVKLKTDPSYNAWQIFLLSLGWTFDSVKQTYGLSDNELVDRFRAVMDRAKAEVGRREYILEATFLRRPTLNSLYVLLRESFIAEKKLVRPLTNESDDVLRVRMDTSFERAVYEVIVRRSDLLGSMSVLLDLAEESGSQDYLSWRTYRKALSEEFNSGLLLGQERTRVAVSQLYVPLRATTRCRRRATKRNTSKVATRETRVFWAEDEIISWIDGKSSGNLRLIGGGPGSGKSTTLRSVAAQLSEREDLRCILFPLQYADVDADLATEITTHFRNRTGSGAVSDPLSQEALSASPRLVLILDGLDEIAKPGAAADKVAQLFAHKLNRLQTHLRTQDPTKEVKIIISGRMPAFQAARSYLDVPDEAAYEVVGFLPLSADSREDEPLIESVKGIARTDQRPDWWQKYAAVFRADADPPERFMADIWRELTHEPLLCYLLVLSGHVEGSADASVTNKNSVYRSLIDQIWLRGWGDKLDEKNRLGPGSTLSQEDFRDLMETIAFAAWRGGDTRIASEEEFKRCLGVTACEEVWRRFKDENGDDVANLAMNFYLKADDMEGRGFEFTHKSFGDYLAATSLLRIAEEMPQQGLRKIDHAMSDWFDATQTCSLSFEILGFLVGEIQNRLDEGEYTIDRAAEVKTYFEHMAGLCAQEGFKIKLGSSGKFRDVSLLQLNSEVALWTIINAFFQGLLAKTGVIYPVDIELLGYEFSARKVIERVLPLDRFASAVAARLFSGLVAPKSDLFALAASNLDLSYSDLEDSNLSWSAIRSWNLKGANLRKCRFLRCNISGTDFTDACMEETHFGGSHIDDSDLLAGVGEPIYVNAATFALLKRGSREKLLKLTKAEKSRLAKTDQYGQEYDDEFRKNYSYYTARISPDLRHVPDEGVDYAEQD